MQASTKKSKKTIGMAGRFASAKLVIATTLAMMGLGCGSYIPAPRGYRTDCSSGGYARSTKYGTFASGSSTCEEYPPEACHPQHPTYQQDVASGACARMAVTRDAHNSKVKTGRIIGWGLLIAVVVLGTAVGASEEDSSSY